MSNIIKIKRGLSSNLSKANLQEGEIAFTTDTKKLYVSNIDEPINNNTTYSLSKSGSTITLTGSDGTSTSVTDSNTTYTIDTALSSTSTNPVQNKVINSALANKADTSAIPTKTSQLTNDSGFKTTDNNTTYSLSKSGTTITLTGSDGSTTSVTDADTNTTYSAATTSANGLMTSAMVTKLNGIATGAEVNQNAFSNVVVGSTTIAATAESDSLTLAAGSNITLTPDATNDKITIAATNTTYSAATTSAAGLMSAADKTKLDGITASADTVSFSQSLTSGTKVGTITINGTATDLYCQTNTNTDTKVTNTLATTTKAYITGTTSATTNTGTQVFDTGVYLDTTAGKLTAESFGGNGASLTSLNASNISSGTLAAARLATSGVTAGSYGPSANVTGSNGTTMSVPYITVDSYGRVTSIANKTYTSVNTDTNTTYSAATTSANGLMSSSDKTKLDGIATGAQVNNVVVSASEPTASTAEVWINPNGQLDISSLWSQLYPVGAIYTSTVSTSPASLFGGTWTQLQNRFLLGAGSSYTAGNTGGSSTTGAASGDTGSTVLTTSQIPSHRHFLQNQNSGGAAASFTSYGVTATSNVGYGYNVWTSYVGGGEGHTHSLNSHTHSNLPPYLVVYMWKRTA